MGFGRGCLPLQRNGKRVVKDESLGPLVSTDMTRCIHCTRCVRFGEEIQGNPQLGTTERGEDVKISTYVEQNIDHELSANIIDLCPVGALNNKPYRYSARAWEMTRSETVAPHDCVGSNLYAHVLRGTIKRIVPRDNESINETWISDRDRFSYEAIYSPDRLMKPLVKEDGEWRDIDWQSALELAASKLGAGASDKLGMLVSPSVTVEEAYLLSRIATKLGTANIDHRIRRQDFSTQDRDPVFESLGCTIAEIERQGAVLVVGSNIRNEAPILAHRLRKATLAGGDVSFVNTDQYEYFFKVNNYVADHDLVRSLAAIATASGAKAKAVKSLGDGVEVSDAHKAIAASLKNADEALVLLGQIASSHGSYSAIRELAAIIADKTGAKLGFVTAGANSAGASLAGVLPHRGVGGEARSDVGRNAAEIAAGDMDAVMLVNVEPDADLLSGDERVKNLAQCDFVVALTPFQSDALADCADLMLPVGTFAETSGTCVNVEGTWQSFAGVASPVGEARPCWKVLRVLGNLVEADGFDYVSSEGVLAEFRSILGDVDGGAFAPSGEASVAGEATGGTDVPLYSVDSLTRRAPALQQTLSAKRARGEG